MPIGNDFRYALRQLRKSPGFTFTVLATLALCIGANTAIFTVVDTLFFRPLPYPDPARLVMVTTAFTKNGASDTDTSQTGTQWELVRDNASFLDAAVYGESAGVNIFSAGRVEYVQQQRVSANFFHVLGVEPLLGREFLRQEDVPGGPPLTVLSYGLWQRLFRGNTSILGRSVELRGAPYTVIGIMPRGFRSNEPVDLWTPLQPSRTGEGEGNNYGVIGRLKRGITFAQADGQLTSIMRPVFERMHVPSGVSVEEKAMPLQLGFTYDMRRRVNLMWGAVGLVLLIGCVNIAGILLARSATRSREIATRMALGAGRARITAQLFAEAVLLALGGGVCGMLVGYFALRGLIALNPEQFEIWRDVHLDARAIAITFALSLVTSIVFGLFPAFEATAVDLRSSLAEGGRGSAGGLRQWKRQLLVFAEVALALVLVTGAGLLIRTFRTLADANPGFDPNHVMAASLSLRDQHYQTAAAGARLFRETAERIRQIPGVEAAGFALTLPYERPLNTAVNRVSGRDVPGARRIVDFTYATPGMFSALRMPLRRGRLLNDADNASAAKVVVVNQAFVRRFLAGDPEPLGTHVEIGTTEYQIVGVVATVQQKNGWGSQWGPVDAFAQAYAPVDQIPDGLFALANTWFSPSCVVRTHGDIPGLANEMRQALEAVDPRLPFSAFHNMRELRGASLREQRYQATLFSVLAGLAILLAGLGVYGLSAQTVTQRTREMGIRLALGATAKGVVQAAAGPGILLAIAGVGCGVVLALFATRLLKSVIWGVTATDPITFVSVALLLTAIAALASVIPALRLARLDPAQTLRNE